MVGDKFGGLGLRVPLLVAGAVIAALMGGCSAGVDAPQESPSAVPPTVAPPSTSAAPTPSEIASRDALAAYRGMWSDFVAAGATSDWRSPALGQHATGVALTNLSRGLYADSANGLVTRGEPGLSPSVTSVEPAGDPSRVMITDCGDSSGSLKYRRSDGSPVSQGGGGRRLINAVVQRQSDLSWKVSDFGVQALGSC